MRVTQLRIFSVSLTIISTVLLCITVSTNQWYAVEIDGTTESYGLFYKCSIRDCVAVKLNNEWKALTIAFAIIALAALVIAVAGFLIIITMNKSAKTVGIFLLLSVISSLLALIIYPIKMEVSRNGRMGLSYFTGCASTVLSAGAGVFLMIAKEERVAPFIGTFTNLTLDATNQAKR